MKKIRELFFDMDGVQADFVASVPKITGMTAKEIDALLNKGEWLGEHIAKGMFLRFKPMKDIKTLVELMKMAREAGVKVSVLSSAGYEHFEKAKADKKAWLKREIDFNFDRVIIVPKSTDKAKYANAGTILVDDREKAIKPFKAAGGNTVTHTKAHKTVVEVMKIINGK